VCTKKYYIIETNYSQTMRGRSKFTCLNYSQNMSDRSKFTCSKMIKNE